MKATPSPDFVLPIPPPVAAGKPPKLSRYSQIAKRSTQWLWPQRVALGKVTLLVGEPGLGKASVAVDLAARVSRGSAWPDQGAVAAPLGTTIVVCAEDEQHESMPARLEAAGADLDKICAIEVDMPDDGTLHSLSPDYELAALRAALEATPDCKLVVIDPLAAYLSGPDGRRSGTMPMLLFALANLAHKYRVAIVVVAHLAGRASFRSIDRMLGTLGPASAPRSVWGIIRDRADPKQRLMLRLDGNFAEEQPALSFRLSASEPSPLGRGQGEGEGEVAETEHPYPGPLPEGEGVRAPRVEWGAAVTTSLEKALAGSSRVSISEQMYRDAEQHVATRLSEALASGPAEREFLNLVVHATEAQLYRAAERLGVVKQKVGYLGNWTWMLPEHVPKWQEQQQQRRAEQSQERKVRRNKSERMARRAQRRAKEAAGLAQPNFTGGSRDRREDRPIQASSITSVSSVPSCSELLSEEQDSTAVQCRAKEAAAMTAQENILPAGQPETGAATVREGEAAASSRARLETESFGFHGLTSNADRANDSPWRHKPPSIFERPPTEFEIDLAACPESRINRVNSDRGNPPHEALLRDATG